MSISSKIQDRQSLNALRELKIRDHSLEDFCSNDYLGLASNKELHTINIDSFKSLKLNGATGSRLISGNSDLAEDLEIYLSDYLKGESALLFNSGYNANLGIIGSVPQRGDTILFDELCHASIRDGIRLSNAKAFKFQHNNLLNLEEKLKKFKGDIFIIIEAVYSMDGDICPLNEINDLAKIYNAKIILDEAHSIGVIGKHGLGLANELGISKDLFARIYAFGKAIGCHGAVIIGNEELKTFLINYARSLIYTTFIPPISLCMIYNAFEYLKNNTDLINKLKDKINLFNKNAPKAKTYCHPIISLIESGNDNVKTLENKLLARGFDVKAILSPTVKEGSERLRLCIHTFNSDASIIALANNLR